jgi:hypothetical protein
MKPTKQGIKDAYKRYVKNETSPLLRKLAAQARQEELRKLKKAKK